MDASALAGLGRGRGGVGEDAVPELVRWVRRGCYLKDDELDELEELEEPPPPPLEELDELEALEELEDELVLLLDELALGELELEDEDDEVAPVGVSPPQAASMPTPASAAPPESSTRNSRLSVSALSLSRTSSSATVASTTRGRGLLYARIASGA